MSVSYGGDSITFADGSIVSSGQPYRNRFINGNMTIDQRNNGSLITGANNVTDVYMTDRWKNNVITGGGAYSAQRVVDAPNQFQHSLKLTVTTTDDCSASGDRYDIAQIIEGTNIVDFSLGNSSAKSFTVSFWVKSSVTGTYSFSVCSASADANYLSTYTILQANTWEYKTITIPPCTFGTWIITPGSSSGGMFCRWSLGAGSNISTSTLNSWTGINKTNLTGGTNWISNSGATFQITGCQIELGTSASSFEYRPYGTELLLCQRYYERIGARADIQLGGYGHWGTGGSVGSNTGTTYNYVPFQVPKRATPSFGYSGTFRWQSTAGADSGSTTTLSATTLSNTSATVYMNGSTGTTVGYWGMSQFMTATSYLEFSSEL